MKVLLINGHRKCGTTLLSLLFDSHPGIISIPSDLNALYAYFPQWSSLKISKAEKSARFKLVTLDEWIRIGAISRKQYEIGCAFLRQLTSDLANACSPAEIFDICINLILSMTNRATGIVVCKETSSEIYQTEIFRNSSHDVQFLTLFRDPRDNLAALKKGSSSYYEAIGDTWHTTFMSSVFRLQLSHKYGYFHTLGHKNQCHIRYEDLCKDPTKTMMILTKWLDIELHPILMQPTVNGAPFTGNSFSSANNKPAANIHGINIGKWSDTLSYKEAAFLEVSLCDLFKDLGYNSNLTDKTYEAASIMYSELSSSLYFSDRFDGYQ